MHRSIFGLCMDCAKMLIRRLKIEQVFFLQIITYYGYSQCKVHVLSIKNKHLPYSIAHMCIAYVPSSPFFIQTALYNPKNNSRRTLKHVYAIPSEGNIVCLQYKFSYRQKKQHKFAKLREVSKLKFRVDELYY